MLQNAIAHVVDIELGTRYSHNGIKIFMDSQSYSYKAPANSHKIFMVQLNKCETDPYSFRNFQCMTMFISVFCKICELNTEPEIVFVLISVDSQGDMCNFRFTNGFTTLTQHGNNQTN